jgi:hypothetical protein
MATRCDRSIDTLHVCEETAATWIMRVLRGNMDGGISFTCRVRARASKEFCARTDGCPRVPLVFCLSHHTTLKQRRILERKHYMCSKKRKYPDPIPSAILVLIHGSRTEQMEHVVISHLFHKSYHGFTSVRYIRTYPHEWQCSERERRLFPKSGHVWKKTEHIREDYS